MEDREGFKGLIGKTIRDIEVVDYDWLGEGSRVDELYRITCNDGEVLHFVCDGGDCSHYGSISPAELDSDGKITGQYSEDLGIYRGEFKSLKK
ncbi:hypothetical protein KAT36_04490 [Candidatus Pacearchaeota archaeon]|nr:hypothetical protein [Candidatus Pacearchaeota archaeon]